MKRLPNAEEQIMSVIWKAKEPPTLRMVMDQVNEKFGHDWKPQTVSTFLTRLRHRGFLEMYQKGRLAYYKPKEDLETYKAAVLTEFEHMFGKLF